MRAAEQTNLRPEVAQVSVGLGDAFRYVLDPDAPLLTNLAALWTVDPGLAERIRGKRMPRSYAWRELPWKAVRWHSFLIGRAGRSPLPKDWIGNIRPYF